MTVSNALTLLEVEGTEVPSLFQGDEPIDVSVVTEGLTEQQTQWVREVKMLDALRAVAGMERAKRLKWIRDDRFPEVPGNGGNTKDGVKVNRPGWANFLRSEFDMRTDDAGYEIRGLESWEEGKTMAKVVRTSGPVSEAKLGSSHLQEIGRVNGIGPELVKKLLESPDPNGRGISIAAIRKEAKALKGEKKLVGIKSVQPAAPKSAPRPMTLKSLPISGTPGGDAYSLTKWREIPQVTEELEWMKAHVEKMRLAAVKYRNLCKQLEDRLAQGIANNRNRPAEMTVYAIIWKEGGYDFDEALESVTSELSEAHRLWGISWPLCHGAAQLVE
jgi:hypothetical protein